MGLDLALLKENKFGDPRFLVFYPKGIIIVHELEIFFLNFQHQIFCYMIYSKNKFQFFDELPKYIMQYLVTAWDNK